MLSGKLRSKRGISLPVAMAITAVLAILSASLIAIAMNSITNTSSSVNYRQAYLNAKSALDYAKSYYSDTSVVPDLSAVKDAQYMVMNDKSGGTTAEGASFVDSEEKANGYFTYVVARYIKPENSKDPGGIKLIAYAKSTDAFGKKSKTVTLGAWFSVNKQAGSTNRLAIPNVNLGEGVDNERIIPNTISLHCKLYPGESWTPFYYTWTYKDTARLYELAGDNCYGVEAGYKDYDENKEREYKVREDPDDEDSNPKTASMNIPTAFNQIQSKDNKLEPSGPWNGDTDPLKGGPASRFAPTGGGWYEATYYINDDQANFFNLIISQKGCTLNGANGEWRPNSQTCEMFHLWFLNHDDKNIYIEFLKPGEKDKGDGSGDKIPDLGYVPGPEWNGSDSLQDRLLIYVKNKKTAIHFKVKGVGDGEDGLTVPDKSPRINSVRIIGTSIYDEDTSYDSYSQAMTSNYYKPSNLETHSQQLINKGQAGRDDGTKYFYGTDKSSMANLQYEGQGWWVANIATGKRFELMLTYYDSEGNDTTFRVPVTPSSQDEAYIVADISKNDIVSRGNEKDACRRINLDYDSYTTVKIKSSEIGMAVAPYLNYESKGVSSTTKRTLNDLIIECQQYSPDNYEDTSYTVFQYQISTATEILNASGKTDSDYKQAIEDLKQKRDALRLKNPSIETIRAFNDKIASCDAIVTMQDNSITYESQSFLVFTAETGKYKTYKALSESEEFQNNETVDAEGNKIPKYTTTDIYSMIDELDAAINALNDGILNKNELSSLLDSTKDFKGDKRFEASYLSNFENAWNTANLVLGKGASATGANTTDQKAIDDAVSALQGAYDELLAHPVNNLDTARIIALIKQAEKLYDNNINCTEKTKKVLEKAISPAKKSYTDLNATQDKVDAAADTLQKAIDQFTVVKPLNTTDIATSNNKVRIWLKGFNVGTVYNRYDDGKGNVVTGTSVNTITSFYMSTYKNNEATGVTYSNNKFTTDGNGYCYIDLPYRTTAEKFSAVSFLVQTNDTTDGKTVQKEYISLSPVSIGNIKDGVLFDLTNLIKGNKDKNGKEVEYTDLSLTRGKLVSLYVNSSYGLTATVNNPDGTTADYDGTQQTIDVPTGIDDETVAFNYQVIRFPYQAAKNNKKQTVQLVINDTANNEVILTDSAETKIGEYVVTVNDESKSESDYLRISYPATSTLVPEGMLTNTGIIFNGADTYTPANFNASSCFYEGTYTPDTKFAIYREYNVPEEEYYEDENGNYYIQDSNGSYYRQFGKYYKITNPYMNYSKRYKRCSKRINYVSHNTTSNQMNITKPGELIVKFTKNGNKENITASYSAKKYYHVNSSWTAVTEIYPKSNSTASSSGSGASSDILSSLVSTSMSDSLLTAPLTASAGTVTATSRFDYFGQSNMNDAEPTKNWGQTVIWIDTNNNYLRDIKDQNGTMLVYAWDNNKLAINGDWPGNPAIRLEDSKIYYVVVSSSCRGLIISRKYPKGSGKEQVEGKDFEIERRGGDPYHNHNIYNDLADVPVYDPVDDHNVEKEFTSPVNCNYGGAARQGHSCLYTIIDNEVLNGTVHNQAIVGNGYSNGNLPPWYVNYDWSYLLEVPGIEYTEERNDVGYNKYNGTIQIPSQLYGDYGSWGWIKFKNFLTSITIKDESSAFFPDMDTIEAKRYRLDNEELRNSFVYNTLYLKYRTKRSDSPRSYSYTKTVVDHNSFDHKNLRMAFVGGDKIRIENASYWATYGTINYTNTQSYYSDFYSEENNNGKTNISLDNLFGGAGGNKGSYGRVGDCYLLSVYDWFEYKIPVDHDDVYTMEFYGLRYDESTVNGKEWYDKDYKTDTEFYTSQISDAIGNVWVVMQDIIPTGGILKNMRVYTQNPDVVSYPDTQELFFKKQTGSGKTISSVSINAAGVDGTKTYTSESYNSDKFKVTVPSNKPFLFITVNFSDGTSSTYRSTLQGDDNVLFTIRANGTSYWDNFVTDEEMLTRRFHEVQGIYYGNVVPVEYNDKGVIVNQGDKNASYLYAEALFDNLLNGRVNEDGSVNTSGLSLTDLNSYCSAYYRLYSLMSKARTYLKPSDIDYDGLKKTGNYPEYLSVTQADSLYSTNSMNNLKAKYKEALTAYLSASSSASTVETAANNLEKAIDGLSLSTDDKLTIIVLNTDTENRIGAEYTLNYSLPGKAGDVEDPNDLTVQDPKPIKFETTEGNPITFVDIPDYVSNIYNVSIDIKLADGTQIDGKDFEKPSISALDGAWVYVHQPSIGEPDDDDYKPASSYWAQNTAVDYKEISSTTISSGDDLSSFSMIPIRTSVTAQIPVFTSEDDAKESRYRPMTLYFRYNTTVGDYTIKAGAYTFDERFIVGYNNHDIVGSEAGPYEIINIGEKGFRPTINLFSEKAKAFFTNRANYGEYTTDDAKDAKDLRDWVDGNTISVGSHTTKDTVNITLNNGMFSGTQKCEYITSKSLYFRWENNNPLYVRTDVMLCANKYKLSDDPDKTQDKYDPAEIRFASSGVIDASSTYGQHFYFATRDDDSSMSVDFLTDIVVKYLDDSGDEHNFTIREGSYIISRPIDREDYIADLFDEEYWTSMTYVKLDPRYDINNTQNGSSSESSKTRFADPIYF